MSDAALALTYALAKQLITAHSLETSYGRLDLDDELRAAVDQAVRPILKQRLTDFATSMMQSQD